MAVSNLGDGLVLVAFPLMAAGMTNSAGLVAGVVFAQRLPWLLLALPAGALADRLNRGRVMGFADLIRAGVLLALVLATAGGAMSLPLLYLAAVILGSLETLFAGASHASIPLLAGEEHLDRANGYLFATETGGGELLGPALGGAMFALWSGTPFAVDAATFLVSGTLLLSLRSRLPAPERVGPHLSIRADIREGLRFFASHRALRALGVLVCGLALCQSMVMGILVLFGRDVLGLSPAGYGLFLGAGAVGSVAGGLMAGRVRVRLGDAGVLTASAAAAAVSYAVVASTSVVAVAVLGFVVETFAVACGSVASLSLRQLLVPDELRGRVGNAFRMLVWGVIPVGALLGGLVAEVSSLSTAILGAALIQGVIVAASARPLRVALDPQLGSLEPAASRAAA